MPERGGLRLAVLGVGAMGRHHARVIREIEGVDLVGVMDHSGDRFHAADGLPVVSSIHEVLDLNLDAAIVALPTKLHEMAALTLADAGVHTLIEKPVAHDGLAGRRLVEAFDSRGLIAAVGHIERYSAPMREMRMRLSRGELGEVHQIATRRQGPFPERIADVGAAMDLASHDVDLAAWLGGTGYARLCAETFNLSGRQFEDGIVITGRLKSGIVVHHVVNWVSALKERTTTVSGERGVMVADTLHGTLTVHRNPLASDGPTRDGQFRPIRGGEPEVIRVDGREPLRVELEAFRDALLGRPADIVSAADGLNTVLAIETAVLAAQRRVVIEF